MEIITITDEAKRAIANLCNKATEIEYDMILNYPRIIEQITSYEEMSDEQLVKDLDKLGRDSLVHFSKMDNMITRLGSEMTWQTHVLPRVVDVLDILKKQLGKEKFALETYKEAKNIALKNQQKVKVRGFFGKLLRIKDTEEGEIITTDEVINTLDRLISDETNHARVVEDSIATLNMLMSKRDKS